MIDPENMPRPGTAEVRLATALADVADTMNAAGPLYAPAIVTTLARMLGALPEERGEQLGAQLHAAGLAYYTALRRRDADRAECSRLFRALHDAAFAAAGEHMAALTAAVRRAYPAVAA